MFKITEKVEGFCMNCDILEFEVHGVEIETADSSILFVCHACRKELQAAITQYDVKLYNKCTF